MFWLEKSKPYQFYYIAIEVQIGPPMASPGCMLWGPFLVWYLRVPIGTTKWVGSPIQAISIFEITLRYTDTLLSNVLEICIANRKKKNCNLYNVFENNSPKFPNLHFSFASIFEKGI